MEGSAAAVAGLGARAAAAATLAAPANVRGQEKVQPTRAAEEADLWSTLTLFRETFHTPKLPVRER